MMKYTPYTYLIGWKKYNKYYYGVRYAEKTKCLYETGCHPDDLWNTYFTTSEKVKDFRNEYGEPDIIEVRKTFNNANDAIKWEEKVLHKIGVLNNNKWLNENVSGAIQIKRGKDHPWYGKKHSKETKKKMSEWQQGEKSPRFGTHHSEETKQKMSESQKEKTKSKETKERMKEAWIERKKRGFSEETRKRMSKSHKGKKHPISEETKRKISETLKRKHKQGGE